MKRNHPEVCNEGGQPIKSLKSSNKINDSLLKTQHGSNNNTNNSGNKNTSSNNNNNGLGNLDLSQFSLLSAEMKRELAGAGVQPSPLSEDKTKNNNLSNGAALAALLKQTTNTNNHHHHNHHPETPTQQQVQQTHHTESTKSQAEQLLEHLRATTTPSLANMNIENNLPNLLSKLSAGINKTNQTNQLINNNNNSDKSSSNNNLIKNGRSEDSLNASPNLGDEPLAKRSKAESLLDLISGN